MKKLFIIILLILAMACNKTNESGSQNNSTENKPNKNSEEKNDKKEEPQMQNIAEKGGEIEVVLTNSDEESEVFLISAFERKGKYDSEYAKKEVEKRLDEGESYYFLTIKIKNGGEIPLEDISPEYFQLETEDGTLYKRNYEYMGNTGEIADAMDIDDVPVGASREVKLSYKIRGNAKSLNFVLNGDIGGKVMLK